MVSELSKHAAFMNILTILTVEAEPRELGVNRKTGKPGREEPVMAGTKGNRNVW